MSKKITSVWFLVAAMLLSLPSYAQVQKKQLTRDANGQKTEMRSLSKGLKVKSADVAKQKKQLLAKVAKEGAVNIADEAIGKWDWAAHAVKPFVSTSSRPQMKQMAMASQQANLRGKLATQRDAFSVSGNAFGGGKTNTARYAATTNVYGIITAPDEGEHKYYTREGWAYYASNGFIYYTEQSGTVEIVETADGTVYIKDIVSRYPQGTWVKGVKEGNTITIPTGQPVAFNTNYMATLSVTWGGYNEEDDEFVRLEGDIVFTVDGDVITLEGSTDDHFVGIYWDDDDSFSGNGDYETVWTLDEGYVPPSTTLIELPAGATVETWYAEGSDYSGTLPSTAKVAFVENEVYVSGIFAEWPNAWIMGTLEGTTVTFPTLQYLGYNDMYGVDFYSYAANVDELAGTYVALDAITFTYDEEAKTLTMDPDQALVLNAATDRMYYLNYITDLTLSVNEPVVEPNTIPFVADLTLQSEFKKFKVIDNNGDGSTWTWSAGNGTYYKYSEYFDGDDYLVVPIEVEAGKNYNVTVNAAAYSDWYPERFEVKVGKEGTAAGLNTTVIAPTDLESQEFTDFEGDFTADESGIWYVAIHAISDADSYYMLVSSLMVEFGADPTAPAAVADFAAVAGEKGALEVNIAFTAPATAIDGSALVGTQDVTIFRDNEAVKTFEGVAAGAELTWQDTDVEDSRSYAYYVQASNESGVGAKSEKVSVWVGQDIPADIENVQITDMLVNGLTMTWDPTVGVNGGYIDATQVKYSVTTIEMEEFWGFQFPVEGETLGTVTGETTATVNYPVDEGEPSFGYFGVKATVGKNESDPTSWLAYALIGAPYELPILETFTGSALHYIWDYNENTGLAVSTDGSDDAIALALTAYEDGAATFETFKLNLKSAANATLVFDAKKGTSTTDKITVYGITPDGTTTDIETVTLTDEYQTYKVVVPAELKNERWARLAFKAELESEANVLIDNIKILDLYEYDLSVAVSAPKTVLAGSAATITATVKNEGEFDATGYNVVIKAGEAELLNTTVNEALPMFATAEFTAELTTTIFDDAADVNITAVVTYANDLNPDNDKAEALISIKESSAPAVTEVTASSTNGSVLVGWTAPATDAVQAEEVTEDFEEGNGGWAFVDADGDGYNWYYQFGAGADGKKLTAHSGEGVVASASYDNDTNSALTPDNWLISPDAVLDGTFSFWAIGQDADYAKEHFQVYVSTTSATDLSTFEAVSEEFIATGEYKEYSVDLSAYAGAAGWIAIRHFNVTDEFVLVVDDITYLAGAVAAEIDHFNIYLDGELAADAAADAATATLENVADGTHTVAVSVVYTNGQESKPVATTVTVSPATGLNAITVITKPVDIYSLDGKLVRKQTTSVDGLKGVYVVDGKKVILK